MENVVKDLAKQRYSILIVDDEKFSVNVLAHILRHGYTIYTAKDGKTGLEMANEYMPDIILLDIIMPEMDGYEVLSVLKSSEKTKHIPVIFVTGLDSGESTKNDPVLGMADCIYKPFKASDVRAKVEKHIKMAQNV